MLPEIERQRKHGKEVVVRADAAFAKPEIYEALEERGVNYAIRIPANENLCTELTTVVPKYVPGERYQGVSKNVLLMVAGADHIGELQAWDLDSGKRAFQFRDALEVTKASRAWFLVDPPAWRLRCRAASDR